MPGGTLVTVSHIAAYLSSKNFYNARSFEPERWLGHSDPLYDPKYANDCKEVFKPFSFGPRNCIGINLAYAEMRLILSKLLWNFDCQLMEESNEWATSIKVYAVYQRDPLMIKLVPVVRD